MPCHPTPDINWGNIEIQLRLSLMVKRFTGGGGSPRLGGYFPAWFSPWIRPFMGGLDRVEQGGRAVLVGLQGHHVRVVVLQQDAFRGAVLRPVERATEFLDS